MRGWQAHELGEPVDTLVHHDDLEAPGEPGPGQVVVQTRAVGLSFPDVLMCRGTYQVPTALPYTPGTETAGIVSAVGDGVEHLAPGDRCVAMGGGLLERIVTSAASAWAIPDRLSFEGAAAVPVNYGTTWYALHDRGALRPGEVVLVTGAAGGTGSAAVQLAKAAGATVIAVAGGEDKVAHCRALGADHVLDHQRAGRDGSPDLVTAVRALTDGAGVDVAYDPVGGALAHEVRRMMAWDGRMLVIGFVAGIPDLPANHILLKNYSVVGVHWGASLARDPASLGRQMGAVMELAADGTVDPLLNPTYSFADAPRALQDLADRRTYGKVVVITD